MSWWLVLFLAAGAYAFKVLGLVVFGGRRLPPRAERCLALIPPALIAALVMLNTVTAGHHLVIDARLAGVAAGITAAWRRAPLIVVIVLAAAVTAAVRAAA